MKTKKMTVAGVMSGTSADGIDVALVEMAESGDSSKGRLTFRLIGHADYPYPRKVRAAVLAAMNAPSASVADLARLNFLLGELYSEAIWAAQHKFRVKANLVGCHGQTLYHQGEAARFLGRKITATWQTGEGAVLAARVGVPVVTDFRPSDMASGGKGAPLVPFLDSMLFRDSKVGRIALNIGGIANLTAIPAGASIKKIVAFDTGPGNMVIDAVTERLFGRNFDRDGSIAATGRVLDTIVACVLRQEFFFQKAAEDRWARGIWAGIRGAVFADVPRIPAARYSRHSNRHHCKINYRSDTALRDREKNSLASIAVPRCGDFRWRGQESDSHSNVRQRTGNAAPAHRFLRRLWHSICRKRGSRLRGARL
jgi:1,6-anhydro-N-acetylmuramate kinase